MIQSKTNRCPNCNLESKDEPYFNDKEYPIITNYKEFYDGLTDNKTWTETHKCTNCNTHYYLETGI